MKNLHILPFLVVSTLLLLTSCTFQKRVHNRGFHIDWKGTKSIAPQSIVKNQQLKKADKEAVKLDSVQAAPSVILSEPTPQVSAGADLAEPIILPKAKENYFKKEFNTQKEQLKKMAKPSILGEEKEFNKLALIGLLLGIAGILLLSTIVFAYEAELLAIYALSVNLLGLIISIVALKQIKANPDKWKGKEIAFSGYIIGITSILVWLIIMGLAVIFYSAYA
ncbi:MAG: DUF4190 domain-containing protein [Bacteroidia bacterium]